MNKSQLIEVIANRAGVSKVDTEEVLKAFVDATIDAVNAGEKVVIAGLGTFEKIERAARMGINPQTKEKIEIKAKTAPKFKAAKYFKESII